jgi:hypothetical protein
MKVMVANTLAYYDTESTTAVESVVVAPVGFNSSVQQWVETNLSNICIFPTDIHFIAT